MEERKARLPFCLCDSHRVAEVFFHKLRKKREKDEEEEEKNLPKRCEVRCGLSNNEPRKQINMPMSALLLRRRRLSFFPMNYQ